MRAILRKGIRDNRVMMISLALTNFGIAWLVLAIFPAFEESLSDMEVPPGFEGLLPEGETFGSPVGYLNSQFFGFMPLIFIALAIVAGTGALVGEESAGTMDMLLAQPVRRRDVVLGRALALIGWLVLIVLAGFPGLLVGAFPIDFDLSAWEMFLGTVAMIPVTVVFAGFVILCAAAFETRAAAAATASAVLVGTYFANLFGAAAESLEFLRWISPFYWSDSAEAMSGDFPWAGMSVLLALTVVFVLLAMRAYERKDIASGAREFNWLRLLRRKPAAA